MRSNIDFSKPARSANSLVNSAAICLWSPTSTKLLTPFTIGIRQIGSTDAWVQLLQFELMWQILAIKPEIL
jgi:hypothetical protein